MPKPFKHILVIRMSAMGDVAMTVPVIRACIEQYPNLKITILTRAIFKPFFRGVKNISVFEADVIGKHSGVFGLWKLSKELKKLNVDAVADLHNVLRSNILKLFLSGTTFQQIDKGRSEKKALVSGQKFEQLKTTHQRYVDVFEKLEVRIDLSNPSFPQKTEFNSACKNIIGDYISLIGIAPFAAFKSKAYPIQLMEVVIEELSKENKILLFGGGHHEIKALIGLENKFNNVISLAGKLNLDEELDVISNINVMLSMDSANAHIAAMLGIDVITLWGATHPFAGFYPFNQDNSNALLAKREKFPLIPTSVYGNKFPVGYDKAIRTITPQEIIEKVNLILNRTR